MGLFSNEHSEKVLLIKTIKTIRAHAEAKLKNSEKYFIKNNDKVISKVSEIIDNWSTKWE